MVDKPGWTPRVILGGRADSPAAKEPVGRDEDSVPTGATRDAAGSERGGSDHLALPPAELPNNLFLERVSRSDSPVNKFLHDPEADPTLKSHIEEAMEKSDPLLTPDFSLIKGSVIERTPEGLSIKTPAALARSNNPFAILSSLLIVSTALNLLNRDLSHAPLVMPVSVHPERYPVWRPADFLNSQGEFNPYPAGFVYRLVKLKDSDALGKEKYVPLLLPDITMQEELRQVETLQGVVSDSKKVARLGAVYNALKSFKFDPEGLREPRPFHLLPSLKWGITPSLELYGLPIDALGVPPRRLLNSGGYGGIIGAIGEMEKSLGVKRHGIPYLSDAIVQPTGAMIHPFRGPLGVVSLMGDRPQVIDSEQGPRLLLGGLSEVVLQSSDVSGLARLFGLESAIGAALPVRYTPLGKDGGTPKILLPLSFMRQPK